MNVPPRLPGTDVPLASSRILICPHCGRKIDVAFLGKDGKVIAVRCPICSFKISIEFIMKFIAKLKEKSERK